MNELNPNNAPAQVEHGVVRPPNEDLQNYQKVGSSHDLSHALDVVKAPNTTGEFREFPDKVGGSHDLGKSTSQVEPSNDKIRFSTGDARMSQPPSANQWSPGAVPVRGVSSRGPRGMNPSFLKKGK